MGSSESAAERLPEKKEAEGAVEVFMKRRERSAFKMLDASSSIVKYVPRLAASIDDSSLMSRRLKQSTTPSTSASTTPSTTPTPSARTTTITDLLSQVLQTTADQAPICASKEQLQELQHMLHALHKNKCKAKPTAAVRKRLVQKNLLEEEAEKCGIYLLF